MTETMTLAHLLAFNLTLLAALAAPGPALLFALRQSVSGGFAVGLATGAGLGLMAAAWTGAALLGLEVVFRLFPAAFVAMKIAGAAYLLWVAYCLWRDARTPVTETLRPRHRAFLDGLLVNLANPKSVLFAAALASPPARAGYLRLKPVVDRTAAVILGGLGLRLLWGR